MAIQLAVATRNARLNAIQTEVGNVWAIKAILSDGSAYADPSLTGNINMLPAGVEATS